MLASETTTRPRSGQPSSSSRPLWVSGSYGHLSSVSRIASLSLSGTGARSDAPVVFGHRSARAPSGSPRWPVIVGSLDVLRRVEILRERHRRTGRQRELTPRQSSCEVLLTFAQPWISAPFGRVVEHDPVRGPPRRRRHRIADHQVVGAASPVIRRRSRPGVLVAHVGTSTVATPAPPSIDHRQGLDHVVELGPRERQCRRPPPTCPCARSSRSRSGRGSPCRAGAGAAPTHTRPRATSTRRAPFAPCRHSTLGRRAGSPATGPIGGLSGTGRRGTSRWCRRRDSAARSDTS